MTWPGTKVLFLTAIALIACPDTGVAQSAGSPAGSLRVQLLFDGRPLLSKLEADFSCFDHTNDKWINCRIESADGIQSYVMPRPVPGWYRMNVNLNENEDNPDSYPGDYVAIQRFEITPDGPGILYVDVPSVIHLTAPIDNNRSVEGVFAACDSEPDYIVPFLTFDRTVPVTFSHSQMRAGIDFW